MFYSKTLIYTNSIFTGLNQTFSSVNWYVCLFVKSNITNLTWKLHPKTMPWLYFSFKQAHLGGSYTVWTSVHSSSPWCYVVIFMKFVIDKHLKNIDYCSSFILSNFICIFLISRPGCFRQTFVLCKDIYCTEVIKATFMFRGQLTKILIIRTLNNLAGYIIKTGHLRNMFS